jgi:UDP-N-acetylmuramoyl-L-alanyl-D-glutamate--2,6-diaminopimelate ligase
MTLQNLISVLPNASQQKVPGVISSMEVSGVFVDSRKIVDRGVFVAIKGGSADSHNFLKEVITKNPAALVVQDITKVPTEFKGIVLPVENSREALDMLASRFYEDPSRRLFMFGVTGTNGKTSCTYIFEHIFNNIGFPTGVIGTINHHLKEKVWATETTTPGPLELQQRLADMRDFGAKAVAMEVSSHALDQYRADSVHFNVVMFTNLTRDHLDYHDSMEKYFAAKQRLFTDLLWSSGKVPQFAVINTDDPFGRKLRIAGFSGLWTYGKRKDSDFRFEIIDEDFSYTEFKLTCPFGEFATRLPICGEHSVYNVVGVVASTAALGVPIPVSLHALINFPGVPGRLQIVPNGKNINVLVDYAHSPDALDNVLQALNRIRITRKTQNRIITVFGCGGDRDKGKRPQMAKIAEKYSDLIIVTSDNPRTENPMTIIDEIIHGFSAKAKPFIQEDRKKAIQLAIHSAHAGDVVLIAGKGHEDYQIVGTEKTHFSDFEVAKEFLE